MNDEELLDEYHSMQEDYKILALRYGALKKNISFLIASTGEHPAFTLPPVSLFIAKLKEILNG